MQELDEETRNALNKLSRHQAIYKLLKDINADLMVCQLEGWNRLEYITQLKHEIDAIYYKLGGI